MKNGGRKLNAEGGLSGAYVGKGLGVRAHADLTVSGNFKREEVNASSSKLHAGPANHSFHSPSRCPSIRRLNCLALSCFKRRFTADLQPKSCFRLSESTHEQLCRNDKLRVIIVRGSAPHFQLWCDRSSVVEIMRDTAARVPSRVRLDVPAAQPPRILLYHSSRTRHSRSHPPHLSCIGSCIVAHLASVDLSSCGVIAAYADEWVSPRT